MRILLVDDESLIRMDLRDQLEALGHTIIGEAEHGARGLELVRETRPDVVLMDVKMPVLDGIEAARQMQHLGIAPVVLLTAYSQAELVERAQESGVYGYLIKPLREIELEPTLKMAVGRFQKEQERVQTIERLEEQIEEQKLSAKAVAILAELKGLSEGAAYEVVRKYSMDHKITIVETCQRIIRSYKKK